MMKMTSLCLLGQADLVWIDPETAGERYNGLTCHQHPLAQQQNPARARYIPVDSMAEYWLWSWRDILELGLGLHAAQDAFEPHHNYNYLGRGHTVFEEWSVNKRNTRDHCRQAFPSGICESDDYLEEDLYAPQDIIGYLHDDPWQSLFDRTLLTENIVANAAELAADWNYETWDVANPEEETYQKAINWQANVDEDQNYWADPLALGHGGGHHGGH